MKYEAVLKWTVGIIGGYLIVKAITDSISNSVNRTENNIGNAFKNIGDAFNNLYNSVSDSVNTVTNAPASAFNGLRDTVVNDVSSIYNQLFSSPATTDASSSSGFGIGVLKNNEPARDPSYNPIFDPTESSYYNQ